MLLTAVLLLGLFPAQALVVRVNANGTVKALKKGTAIITVTTKDGRMKATCRVTVR